jgi:hypothetical protein
MGRTRINLNEPGLGNKIFNNLIRAFVEEHGYHPDAYDGYYKKKSYWESELSGWLGHKGFPCLMYSDRKSFPIGSSITGYNPIGLEMEEKLATLFLITWS